jgi:hypothetical protein
MTMPPRIVRALAPAPSSARTKSSPKELRGPTTTGLFTWRRMASRLS